MDLLNSPLHTTRPARVEKEVFLGVVWGGVWISFVFVCIRVFSRWKFSKRLFIDDAFVIFAWLLALGTAIDWQCLATYMYQSIAFTSGQLFPPPDNFITHMREYLHGNAVVLLFFYTSLWSIKISFLLFFRRLDRNLERTNWLWWAVTVFNVASYIACIGDIQYWCLTPPLLEIVKNCSSSKARDFEVVTLKFNTSMDVVTDYLIVIIPIKMLWNVQMSIQKKLLLMGVFSLVIITTVISIVRVAVVTDLLASQPDESWAFMWSSIEQSVAIIVACLASFRTLFVHQTPRYQPPRQKSFIDALRRRKLPVDDSDMTTTLTNITKTTNLTQTTERTLAENNHGMMMTTDLEMGPMKNKNMVEVTSIEQPQSPPPQEQPQPRHNDAYTVSIPDRNHLGHQISIESIP